MALQVLIVIPAASAAAANPFARGPDPTAASVEAMRGPFAVDQITVWRSGVRGFGGGTIFYPETAAGGTAGGTFGAVAIAPGFTATQASIRWLGPRLASQGFVVIIIDTLTVLDQPSTRSDQLVAALDHLIDDSPVSDRVDRERLSVMGHSMGGGGAVEAALDNPRLQAAVSLTGWHTTKDWAPVQVPTLVVGAEYDSIAPVGRNSERFYDSLPSTLDKAYLELDGATHFAPNVPNRLIAKYAISWLKRFVDDDTRYDQFLCGDPHRDDLAAGGVQEYRDTCPHP